jgi:hypothetical protein
MTDKKAEIPFPQNAAAHQGNKDINGATRKATPEKKYRKRKMTWIQRRVFRSI